MINPLQNLGYNCQFHPVGLTRSILRIDPWYTVAANIKPTTCQFLLNCIRLEKLKGMNLLCKTTLSARTWSSDLSFKQEKVEKLSSPAVIRFPLLSFPYIKTSCPTFTRAGNVLSIPPLRVQTKRSRGNEDPWIGGSIFSALRAWWRQHFPHTPCLLLSAYEGKMSTRITVFLPGTHLGRIMESCFVLAFGS